MCSKIPVNFKECPKERQVPSVSPQLPNLVHLACLVCTTRELPYHGLKQQHPFMFCIMLPTIITRSSSQAALQYIFSFYLSSYRLMAWPADGLTSYCLLFYFASFNRCRCTHCWNAFPRSPQLLIILLKWLCICHNFHIKIICTHKVGQIMCCEQLIELSSVYPLSTACSQL